MIHAQFSAALFDPLLPPPGDIVVRHGVDPARRFGVYRNNVIVALIDALADTYPVVAALVGEEFLRGMARAFARHHPPRSPVMAEYGAGFADFIDAFAPAQSLPYLGDMARLEWQRVVAFHAADANPLLPAAVAPLASDPNRLAALRWTFHPSVALVESPFAVVSLWLAHQHTDAGMIEHALSQVDMAQGEAALVLRQGLEVLILNLASGETAFIRALLCGEPLAAAAELASHAPEPLDLTLTFALLLRSGALLAYQ